jgi:hypothetical protein
MNASFYEFKPIRIRLSLRTDYIFYPIDSDIFSKTIERFGFKIKNRPQIMGPLILEIQGQIAEKEDTLIGLDTNTQLLTVDGQNPQKIVEIFEELEDIIKNELKIDYSKSIKFFETIVDYNIFSEHNPRIMIEKIPVDTKLSTEFSKIVGKEVSPFTIRYASKGISPDSAEWMDFRIEPLVRRSDRVYTFNLVHREKDISNVKRTLININKIMDNILKQIES